MKSDVRDWEKKKENHDSFVGTEKSADFSLKLFLFLHCFDFVHEQSLHT